MFRPNIPNIIILFRVPSPPGHHVSFLPQGITHRTHGLPATPLAHGLLTPLLLRHLRVLHRRASLLVLRSFVLCLRLGRPRAFTPALSTCPDMVYSPFLLRSCCSIHLLCDRMAGEPIPLPFASSFFWAAVCVHVSRVCECECVCIYVCVYVCECVCVCV